MGRVALAWRSTSTVQVSAITQTRRSPKTTTVLRSAGDANPMVPDAVEVMGLGFFLVFLILPLLVLVLTIWAVVLVMRTATLDITAKGVLLILALMAPILGPILVLLLCRQSRRGRAVDAEAQWRR